MHPIQGFSGLEEVSLALPQNDGLRRGLAQLQDLPLGGSLLVCCLHFYAQQAHHPLARLQALPHHAAKILSTELPGEVVLAPSPACLRRKELPLSPCGAIRLWGTVTDWGRVTDSGAQ